MKRLLLLLLVAGCSPAPEPVLGPLILPPDPPRETKKQVADTPPAVYGDRLATMDEMSGGDFGKWIGQVDSEQSARALLKVHLKDYETARIEFGQVKTGGMQIAFDKSFERGYILTANINAKNSFGAYVGFEPYIFLFHDATLTGVWQGKVLQTGQLFWERVK